MTTDDGPSTSSRTALLAALAVLVALVVAVLVVAQVAFDDEDGPGQAAPVERVGNEAWAQVDVGSSKEEVLRSLRPAQPLDSAVIAEYRAREPQTPAAECVYYESEGGTADDRYRLCFVQDRLVDKTVVLPEEDGVTGS